MCCKSYFFPGQKVLVKLPFSSKFASKGEVCVVIEQLNFDTVIVRNTSSRVFSVTCSRVSPVPTDEAQKMSNRANHADEQSREPMIVRNEPRRSKRVRFAPDRFIPT